MKRQNLPVLFCMEDSIIFLEPSVLPKELLQEKLNYISPCVGLVVTCEGDGVVSRQQRNFLSNIFINI